MSTTIYQLPNSSGRGQINVQFCPAVQIISGGVDRARDVIEINSLRDRLHCRLHGVDDAVPFGWYLATLYR